MPEISRFYGIVIYMFIGDHNPPHFHVYYEGESALISIKNGKLLKGSLPQQARRLVKQWLELRRNELLDNWNRLSNSESAVNIKPLR
jgi:hypothetical protein